MDWANRKKEHVHSIGFARIVDEGTKKFYIQPIHWKKAGICFEKARKKEKKSLFFCYSPAGSQSWAPEKNSLSQSPEREYLSHITE